MRLRVLLFGLTLLLVTGCSTRSGSGSAERPTPTPSWVPVPTFTPTPQVLSVTAEPEQSATPVSTPEQSLPAQEDVIGAIAAEDGNGGQTETDAPLSTQPPQQETDPEIEQIITEPILTVVDDLVNVRQGPSTVYGLLGSVSAGQQFPLLGRNEQGDWWQVCCFDDDQPGWVFGALVEVENIDGLATITDLPALPTTTTTPIPVVVEEPTSEPQAEDTAPSSAASGTAGNFDPNAQFHIVHYRAIGYGENNGGIFNNGGQHMIFVNVVDENGQGIDGAVVKDAVNDKLNLVMGSKGPGRAEFEMFGEKFKLYVAATPSGPVTSQVSNQMDTVYPHLPDIIGKLGSADDERAICPTADDRCEPPFYHAHWSYEITFQKVK